MKHTAIPWYQHPADVSRIVSADELAVATVFDADDGAFIVQACNAHAALVAVAEAVLLFHSGGIWGGEQIRCWHELTGRDVATTKELCDFTRAVLAKATS